MAKAEKEVVNSTLTKTQARVMMAICAALGLEATDKKVIAKKGKDDKLTGTTELVDKEGNAVIKVEGVDIAKVSRQLHREDLVYYGWNEDRSRYIGITEEGFNQLQLPIKERVFPAKKEKVEGEEKPKKEKSKGKTKAEKAEGNLAAEPDAENEGPEMPVVKPNPLMKNFIVTYGGKKKIHKAKDQAEFDALKERTPEEWLPLFA